MRHITFGLLACLLLTACTVGIVKREEVTLGATLSPTPDTAATEDAIVTTRVAATVTALKLSNPITPTVTTLLTPTLTPPPTKPLSRSQPTPLVALPVIDTFTSNTYEIAIGESVTLFWSSTGATRATLRRTTALGAGSFAQDVPPNGSLVVGSEGAGRHWHDYELDVYNSAGAAAARSLTVRFRCPYSLFFTSNINSYLYDPRLCPEGPPQSTKAAEQVFEGGRMIWLEHAAPIRQWDWGAGGKDDFIILALYTPGVAWPQKQTFIDAWTPDEPDSDPTIVPPNGRFQPIRGFGKVWRTHSDVRQKLGWALGQEQGFDAVYQLVSDFRDYGPCLYLTNMDGRVVGLCRRDGSWSFVAP
jgi:hypothetical protein